MIFVAGLSYRTAALEEREMLLYASPTPRTLLDQGIGDEAATLATCNRHETILHALASPERVRAYYQEVTERSGLKIELREGDAAVRHVFRVASSMDSMVVGEPQILHQFRQCEEEAIEAGTVGPVLRRLFVEARRTGARVRRETRLAQGTVSIASIAVRLAAKIFGNLAGRRVLVVGAGEMARLVAQYFRGAGSVLHIIATGTSRRAEELAGELGATWSRSDDLPARMQDTDVVVSATAAEDFVIREPDAARVMAGRPGKPLFLIDVAVPRDIDPACGTIRDVYVYNINDFEQLAAEHRKRRMSELAAADRIVDEAVARWQRIAWDMELRPDVAAAYALARQLEEEAVAGVEDPRTRRNLRVLVRRFLHYARASLETDDPIERALRRGAFRRLFGDQGAS